METSLTIEQRFQLQRARYEMKRMSRSHLEHTALKLLRSRIMQKNGIQETLMQQGILFKLDEMNNGTPEIISEDTFMELLILQDEDDEMPTSIDDVGWEDEDLDDDGLTFMS